MMCAQTSAEKRSSRAKQDQTHLTRPDQLTAWGLRWVEKIWWQQRSIYVAAESQLGGCASQHQLTCQECEWLYGMDCMNCPNCIGCVKIGCQGRLGCLLFHEFGNVLRWLICGTGMCYNAAEAKDLPWSRLCSTPEFQIRSRAGKGIRRRRPDE